MTNVKKNIKFFFLTFALIFILIATYQNCNFDDPALITTDSFTERPFNAKASAPIPGGSIDPSCMNSSEYNACIFFKNPVAQKGSPFDPPITFLTNLSSIQIYGVNITGTIDGLLKNGTYDIVISWDQAQRTQVKADGTWKFEYANDPNHHVAQVMAYYWLTYQMSYMQQKASWYAENRNIQVNVLSSDLENDAYFSSRENTIALGHFTLKGQIEAALSADIVLHEAAHASFYYSNSSRGTYSENTHRSCSDDQAICCTSYRGCFKAINEGQADFHSLIIFSSLSSSSSPLIPLIGEGVTNELSDGLGICIPRNMNYLSDQLATNVYDGCDSQNDLQGEIHMMGALYASIWWNIYTHPFVVKDEIIELFVEHLAIISSEDTFESIGTRILSLEQQKFSGKYSQIITQAFTERGLTL